jgi:hypothetical protein
MYPQSVSAGTRVDIVYHPVTRRIGDVNYTGRLYIQLPGEDVKPVELQYPPPGSVPLILKEDISILFEVRVVNADTGAETGNDYETAADQKPDTPGLATWNFTDAGQLAGGTVEFKFQSAAEAHQRTTTPPVTVPATVKITESSINLAQGEGATLTASGQWNIYKDPNRYCGPAGSGITANNPSVHGPGYSWPQAGISEGCLLVYINDSLVGHFTSDTENFVVTGPGVVGFGPNDDWLSDNSGSLAVTIAF